MHPDSSDTAFASQKHRLDALYRRFHHRRFVHTDPLQLLYLYDAPADREIVGLVAALLAYGNVKAILTGTRNALLPLNPRPHLFLLEHSPDQIRRCFADFRYRVTPGSQLAGLLIAVRTQLLQHGSLHHAFARHLRSDHETVLPAAGSWVDELADASGGVGGAGAPLDHLLPHPARGSACKRLMLYLRWMVRNDRVDVGSWSDVSPALLVAPVDTHLFAMARRFNWTQRKQANLATALEITTALRRFAPRDPLRYDFALTRPGIMRITV
ncbi:MAG: TIGR02757 family protein [Phycisphaeraceae bacterium]